MAINLGGGGAAAGNTIRNGNSAPATSVGSDGDFYINTSSQQIYGPKSASAWGSATSLVGDDGAAGSAGIATIDYKGAYVSTSAYVPGNFVVHSAQTYINTLSSIGSTPPASSWDSFPFVINNSAVGNTTSTTAYASRPAAATNGNLFLPTDSFYLERDNSSTWASWGPVFPFTAPVDGDFSWFNQGGAAVTTTNGGIFLSLPSTGSTQFRGRTQAVTAPYVITAAILPIFYPANYCRAGLFFTDGTKTHVFGFSFNSSVAGSFAICSSTFTNAVTINTDYSLLPYQSIGSIYWLRIADNSTNRICSVSSDGVNFIPFHTIGNTDFLTATHVGFGGDIENSNDGGITLLSWKET